MKSGGNKSIVPSLTTTGTHTIRYNSMIKIQPSTKAAPLEASQEYCLYALGNQVVLGSLSTLQPLHHQKICEDAVMVVKQCSTMVSTEPKPTWPNMFIACTYDGHFIIFSIEAESNGAILFRIQHDLQTFLHKHIEEYGYIRQC